MKYTAISNALSGLVSLFYPQLCASCNASLLGSEQILCLSCLLQLPRTAYHHIPDNRSSRIFTGRVPIEQATSFVYFTKQGMMQRLLHGFKYKGRKEIGIYLGGLFAAELKKNDWLDTVDCIIPVPLHRKKEHHRGFNQAALFAEGIAKVSALPVISKVLIRTKNTQTQTHKTRAERVENVKDVFRLAPGTRFEGKHVLVVDDVLTTGATLESCVLELMKAKPGKISIATLALATD